METKEIKQVIVVEGKTDVQKLEKIYGSKVKTITTQGLRLNQKLVSFLNQVNQKEGIIVFTDPDGPGKKIREQINKNVSGKVLNAFLRKEDIKQRLKKIGVAEADEKAIVEALKKVLVFDDQKIEQNFSWAEYLQNNFYLKKNRQKIAFALGWSSEISSKTMFKWLNWTALTIEDLKNILEI